MLWIVLLICDDERQQGDCFSRPRRHFEDAMTPSIEGPLEITHVGILFGIDARVGEQDGKGTGTGVSWNSSRRMEGV